MSDTQPELILYTQSGCGESAKVRAWLTDRGMAFIERDASADSAAAAALAATGTFATPLVVVGKHTIVGFRPAAVEAALKTSGEP